MRLYYDEEGDFLEISIGKPAPSLATEIEPGVFLRRDTETNEVNSIGILNFKKRSKTLKNIEINLPVKLNISA